MVLVRGMPWPQTGANHYHAQLGLPDKSRAIKALVFCYVVWLGSMNKIRKILVVFLSIVNNCSTDQRTLWYIMKLRQQDYTI